MAMTFDTDVTLNAAKVLKINTINLPTASNGTTYGPGTNGQVMKSNGTTVYWASDSDTNTKVTQTNRTTNATYNVLFSVDTYTTTAKTNSTYKSNNLIFNPSTGLLTVSGDVNSHGKPCVYGQYSASTAPSSPVTGQIWLKNAGMSIEEAKVLIVSTGTVSSLPTTITDSNITSDMVVINKYDAVGTPSMQGSDLTVTTADGSATISGTLNGSTNITLYLMKSR